MRGLLAAYGVPHRAPHGVGLPRGHVVSVTEHPG